MQMHFKLLFIYNTKLNTSIIINNDTSANYVKVVRSVSTTIKMYFDFNGI